MISDNDKGKRPLEDDLQDPELKEGVKVEDKEEGGEDRSSWHHTTIASIGVVKNPPKVKRTARMSTGGRVPRLNLVSRAPSSGNNNPYHTLIHNYQYQKVIESEPPSGWNRNRSSNAGNSEFEKEEWGEKSSLWNSPYDRLLARVEDNAQLIRNLSHQVEDLMELVEKLIKDYPSLPKE